VFSADDDPARPGDGDGDGGREGRYPVPGADGWSFLPLERNDETREHHITLERDDGERVEMTLPSFVEQGDELEEIAALVIRARERWGELKGLGA
jgi:hypothetical protein